MDRLEDAEQFQSYSGVEGSIARRPGGRAPGESCLLCRARRSHPWYLDGQLFVCGNERSLQYPYLALFQGIGTVEVLFPQILLYLRAVRFDISKGYDNYIMGAIDL